MCEGIPICFIRDSSVLDGASYVLAEFNLSRDALFEGDRVPKAREYYFWAGFPAGMVERRFTGIIFQF